MNWIGGKQANKIHMKHLREVERIIFFLYQFWMLCSGILQKVIKYIYLSVCVLPTFSDTFSICSIKTFTVFQKQFLNEI